MKTNIQIDMVVSIGYKYFDNLDSLIFNSETLLAYKECNMSAPYKNYEYKTIDIDISREASVYLTKHKNKEKDLECIAIDNNDIIGIIYSTIGDSCNLAVKIGVWGSSEDRILKAFNILINSAILQLYNASNNITESKNNIDWMWEGTIDDVHLGISISEIENRTTNTGKPTLICYYNTKDPVCIDDMVYVYDVQYPFMLFKGIVKEYSDGFHRDVLRILDTDTGHESEFYDSYLVFSGSEEGLEKAKQVIKEKIDNMDKSLVDSIHKFTDSLKNNITVSSNSHDKYCNMPETKLLSMYYNPSINRTNLVYSDNIDYTEKDKILTKFLRLLKND